MLACAVLGAICLGCGGDGLRELGRYAAGDVEAVLLADATEIDTAGRVDLHLRVTAPEDVEVTLPGAEIDFGDFELFDFTSFPPAAGRNMTIVWEERYVLEPFLAGAYQVPPLVVRFSDPSTGRPERIETAAVPVSVASILGPEAEATALQDIAAVADWPGRRWVWLAPLLALATCAALAVGMFVRWRRRPRKAPAAPRLAPHLVAWRELEALLAEGLLDRREWEPFYIRLTGILRRYIDARFGIRAPKLTSCELIARVQAEQTLEAHDRELLARFLHLGDLVKFGRRAPEAEMAHASVEQCKTILTDTAVAKRGGRR